MSSDDDKKNLNEQVVKDEGENKGTSNLNVEGGENKDAQPSGGNPSNVVADKPNDKQEADFSIGQFIIAGIFELVGTFLFITAILLGSGPEATILAFWIICTMISPFSGGHVNPAITFSYYIYQFELCIGLPRLIYYWIAQIAGGFLALMFAVEIKEKVEIIIFKHAIEYPEFLTEAFFTGTFIFVFLYVNSKTTKISDHRALNCGVIATWLYYAATSAGKRSVGALNPAVLSVFAIYNAHVKENYYEQHKHDIWMTLLAHFGSALFFAILFFIAEKAFPNTEEKVEEKADEKKEENNKV